MIFSQISLQNAYYSTCWLGYIILTVYSIVHSVTIVIHVSAQVVLQFKEANSLMAFLHKGVGEAAGVWPEKIREETGEVQNTKLGI